MSTEVKTSTETVVEAVATASDTIITTSTEVISQNAEKMGGSVVKVLNDAGGKVVAEMRESGEVLTAQGE